MFLSWWLIVPVLIAVAILFIMVSRLSNEVDKLETALEESRGQLKSLGENAEEFKLANLRITENLIRVRRCAQNLQSSSVPEQENLLFEMHCALNLATNNIISNPDFIAPRSTPASSPAQKLNESLPLMFR
ncbi:hypothetical protein [Leclercia sp.]|uniref:hypothetical protein n=1 Tax=Leclercia sp. TaxID=1898428 RepID=UPI002FDCF13F